MSTPCPSRPIRALRHLASLIDWIEAMRAAGVMSEERYRVRRDAISEALASGGTGSAIEVSADDAPGCGRTMPAPCILSSVYGRSWTRTGSGFGGDLEEPEWTVMPLLVSSLPHYLL